MHWTDKQAHTQTDQQMVGEMYNDDRLLSIYRELCSLKNEHLLDTLVAGEVPALPNSALF